MSGAGCGLFEPLGLCWYPVCGECGARKKPDELIPAGRVCMCVCMGMQDVCEWENVARERSLMS